MDAIQIDNLLSIARCEGGMNHVLDLCDGLSLPQLDSLQRQIRDRRNARSGFLRLPGEIRNKIYELVIESEILRPASSTYMDQITLKKLMVGVAGFNMCKQIRYEFRSLLQPENIRICQYDDTNAAFLPVDMDTFAKTMKSARWFRALGCDSMQSAQKSVKLCEDEIGVDCCGTISFGPALGLRPMFFVVDFSKPIDSQKSRR